MDYLEPIVRKARILTVVLPPAAALVFGWRVGISVLVGAGLALLNLAWLAAGVDRLLGRQNPRGGGLVALRFMGRLALIFMALFAMIHTSFLSLTGALLGLSVVVLAGIWEAMALLIRGESDR